MVSDKRITFIVQSLLTVKKLYKLEQQFVYTFFVKSLAGMSSIFKRNADSRI